MSEAGGEILAEKERLRAEMRRRIRAVTAEARAEFSRQACVRLVDADVWKKARTILAYLALKDEIDLAPALQAALREGKVLALPRFDAATNTYAAAQVGDLRESLMAGAFGISEPAPSNPVAPLKQLDLVLVPGLAFDHAGCRLGRGKGHYDRLLAEAGGFWCGVALEEQIVQRLPREAHDAAMHGLLTPASWLECGGRGWGETKHGN